MIKDKINKKMLKRVAVFLLILSVTVSAGSLLFHIIYSIGQLKACESALKINPLAKPIKMYCEYEDGDVWVKSMADVKSRISMTTGKLQVSN